MRSPTRIHRALPLLALFTMVLLVAGCGIFSPDETKDDGGGGGEVSFVPATSPDLVMENFEKAWEAMLIAEYTKLLATDFEFFFDPEDNLEDYVGGPSWGRVDEEASVTAMFTNQAGFDPVTEEPIPPILSIEFETFVPLDPSWQTPPPGDLYEGTVRKRYTVSIKVTYQGTGDTVRVRGENWFYVTTIAEGEGDPLWGIKVWEDKGTSGTGS